jgi:hypothetical protein
MSQKFVFVKLKAEEHLEEIQTTAFRRLESKSSSSTPSHPTQQLLSKPIGQAIP